MSDENGRRPGGEGLSSPEAIALLEKSHDFPCEYMVKVIGFADQGVDQAAGQAVAKALDKPDAVCRLSCRPSRNGRYVAVTLDVKVADSGEVLKVYEALRGLPGLVALV